MFPAVDVDRRILHLPSAMVSQIVDLSTTNTDLERGQEQKQTEDQILASAYEKEDPAPYEKEDPTPIYEDAFGNEEFAEVKYKTLKWW